VSDAEEQEAESRGLPIEAIKSFFVFAKRAVRDHWFFTSFMIVAGISLTVAAARYLPRTFTCRTVLMGDGSEVLERTNWSPFAGAEGLILRHQNLEAIIRDRGLIRKYTERRPPVLKLKDQMKAYFLGEPDAETMKEILIGTLEQRLSVNINGTQLAVTADWTDAPTAAELAEAARESFLKTRHSAEISAFQDKMAILDGHATNLRQEIESLAKQVEDIREQKAAAQKAARGALPSAATGTPRTARRFRATESASSAVPPELLEKLATMKKKLADIDGDRERRLREEDAKLADLKLRLGPSHPQVVTQEQRIAMLAQIPSEVRLLRSEVSSLESEIKQREILAKPGGVTASAGPAPATGSAAEQLPAEIMGLLDDDEIDPALSVQLSGAISKYAALRADLRSSRIELDTAQAAFNYRYKVIVPAEVPNKPSKPKLTLVVIGGVLASLFLALLLPILLELRHGRMTGRWQVHLVSLPVLGELRLPPRGGSAAPPDAN
jgi:uncharacterized protein involved in exopolysaccharide biosynthesis